MPKLSQKFATYSIRRRPASLHRLHFLQSLGPPFAIADFAASQHKLAQEQNKIGCRSGSLATRRKIVTKFLFTAAAAVLTFTAPAAFAGDRTFTHEGVTYTYSVTSADKAQVLEGKTSDGGDFRLTVKNGWVDGYVNNTRVSFRAPAQKAPTQLAAR
jgi:hypothetical protein